MNAGAQHFPCKFNTSGIVLSDNVLPHSLFADKKEDMKGESFGPTLRRIRIHHQTKQAELAKQLGISSTYLCDIESGNRSPLPLEKIFLLQDLFTLSEAETETLIFLAASHEQGLSLHVKDLGQRGRDIIHLLTLMARASTNGTLAVGGVLCGS